jgi:hypothetical protein
MYSVKSLSLEVEVDPWVGSLGWVAVNERGDRVLRSTSCRVRSLGRSVTPGRVCAITGQGTGDDDKLNLVSPFFGNSNVISLHILNPRCLAAIGGFP